VQLEHDDYCIVGDGDYVVNLLDIITKTHGNLPKFIYVRQVNPKLPEKLQIAESAINECPTRCLVLGTNLFQKEIIERLEQYIPTGTDLVDVLMGRYGTKTQHFYTQKIQNSQRYVLFYAINPVENIENYLGNFVSWLNSFDVFFFTRHPLQYVDEKTIANALAIFMWNGAMPIYQTAIDQCKKLQRNVTFVECGFFPQKSFFYFDKEGVNAKSQLMKQDLSSITENDILNVQDAKHRLNRLRENHAKQKAGYIFAPLQVPTDSNVVLHSRFKNGMQEFIDFIEKKYSDYSIIFKPHPKDRHSENYRFYNGVLSTEPTLDLIIGADLVHGINSSVLFEAELLGKKVIAEGECLLNHKGSDRKSVLAAMISRQFSSSQTQFQWEKIEAYSHLSQDKTCPKLRQ
jgi:hypothetical protein